jgi:hypothetical protein
MQPSAAQNELITNAFTMQSFSLTAARRRTRRCVPKHQRRALPRPPALRKSLARSDDQFTPPEQVLALPHWI